MIIEKNKNLKDLNSMKIDSKTDYYVKINNIKELCDVLKFAREKKLKHFILGNGSNTLFARTFYKNRIIIDMKGMNHILTDKKENIIECDAGVKNKDFINFCIRNEIRGFEFLSGIPGTLGGMVKMNAGAFGEEIGNFVKKITVLNTDTMNINELCKNNLNFEYRKINRIENSVILKIFLEYSKGKKEKIKKLLNKFLKLRRKKQPKGFSLGSVFKNSDSFYAGELIDKAGLKGLSSGDAFISRKHANFILNGNAAKGVDVVKLIQKTEQHVFKNFSVLLQREIEVLF